MSGQVIGPAQETFDFLIRETFFFFTACCLYLLSKAVFLFEVRGDSEVNK